jgi:hypothetical protein
MNPLSLIAIYPFNIFTNICNASLYPSFPESGILYLLTLCIVSEFHHCIEESQLNIVFQSEWCHKRLKHKDYKLNWVLLFHTITNTMSLSCQFRSFPKFWLQLAIHFLHLFLCYLNRTFIHFTSSTFSDHITDMVHKIFHPPYRLSWPPIHIVYNESNWEIA